MATENPRETLEWTALSFLLISEVALLGSGLYLAIVASESNQRIVRTGILSTLAIYWVISLILMLFRGVFAEKQTTFVIVNLLLIGVVIIICVLLNAVASKIRTSDRETAKARFFLQNIEKSLFALKSNSLYADFKTELDELFEKVRFSDHCGNSTYDKALLAEVDKLKAALNDNDGDKVAKVTDIISHIAFNLEQRNMELSQGKTGGF